MKWLQSAEHAEFCQRVKARRKELGLTQVQMAQRLGIADVGVSNLENGRNAPGFDMLYRVAEALEVPVNDLLPAPVTAR